MIRSLVLVAALAATLTPALLAQPAGPVVGKAAGDWNTPFGLFEPPGQAVGVLTSPQASFALDAIVLPAPSPFPSGIQGVIDGTLVPLPFAPGLDVFASVTGSWTYDETTDTGEFSALLVTPIMPGTPPGVPRPPMILGRLKGVFFDRFTPPAPDLPGRFVGGWLLLPTAFTG